MEAGALLDELVALAQEAGIRVRQLPRSGARPGEGEPAARSGLVRMRGEPWLILAPEESLEDRIDAAASALRHEAQEWLEGRYLAPAVRERLDLDAG